MRHYRRYFLLGGIGPVVDFLRIAQLGMIKVYSDMLHTFISLSYHGYPLVNCRLELY
jgi:hypothetical protein